MKIKFTFFLSDVNLAKVSEYQSFIEYHYDFWQKMHHCQSMTYDITEELQCLSLSIRVSEDNNAY